MIASGNFKTLMKECKSFQDLLQEYGEIEENDDNQDSKNDIDNILGSIYNIIYTLLIIILENDKNKTIEIKKEYNTQVESKQTGLISWKVYWYYITSGGI